jgi:hypothetical protein
MNSEKYLDMEHSEEDLMLPNYCNEDVQSFSTRFSGKRRGYWDGNVLVHALLFILYNVLYLLSLRPAETPKEMNSMLGLLGGFLLGSAAILSVQLWYIFRTASSSTRWVVRGALQLLPVAVWYWLDNGNTLQSHGSYNLLIFFLMAIPLNTIMAILYIWNMAASYSVKGRRSRSRFWKQFIAAALVCGMIVYFQILRKTDKLAATFFDKDIPCSSADAKNGLCTSCQWKETIPWFDLLPFRENFFVVSVKCSEAIFG